MFCIEQYNILQKTKNCMYTRCGLKKTNITCLILGNTATDLALDLLRVDGYEGDRADAPNIAIVVTDGYSTSPDLTKVAAQNLKDENIITFAIGESSFK